MGNFQDLNVDYLYFIKVEKINYFYIFYLYKNKNLIFFSKFFKYFIIIFLIYHILLFLFKI